MKVYMHINMFFVMFTTGGIFKYPIFATFTTGVGISYICYVYDWGGDFLYLLRLQLGDFLYISYIFPII